MKCNVCGSKNVCFIGGHSRRDEIKRGIYSKSNYICIDCGNRIEETTFDPEPLTNFRNMVREQRKEPAHVDEKQGQWIEFNFSYSCSVCGHTKYCCSLIGEPIRLPNYCDNCGAKMNEEEIAGKDGR